MEQTDVIIVGAGPAGVSASLYLRRAGYSVTVIAKDGGALMKADTIGNYYGIDPETSGEELFRRGVAGAERIGVTFLFEEVTALLYDGDGYTAETEKRKISAKGLLLAVGTERKAPPVPGLDAYLGRGLSFCAHCDIFACRGRHVAVIGNGPLALHEAEVVSARAESVTILTGGLPAAFGAPSPFPVIETPILGVMADEGDTLTGLRLEDGTEVAATLIFSAEGSAGASRLALSLGIPTEGGRISVDENGATPLPGLYAAGDCIGGFLQVSKAVSDGAKAGAALSAYLKKHL